MTAVRRPNSTSSFTARPPTRSAAFRMQPQNSSTSSSALRRKRLRIDLAPLAQRQIGNADPPYFCPHQSQRRISGLGGHAPHLPVLAFAQSHFDPGGGNLRAVTNRRIARPECQRLVDELCPR